jgi:hypothetical protein
LLWVFKLQASSRPDGVLILMTANEQEMFAVVVT